MLDVLEPVATARRSAWTRWPRCPYLYVPGRGAPPGRARGLRDVRHRHPAAAAGRAVRQRHLHRAPRRGHARLHPRLPLLPRRHLVPAGARAPGRRGRARPGWSSSAAPATTSSRSPRSPRATTPTSRRRSSGIKAARPELHLSLPSNRVDTGPVAMTAAANARQSLDHARARGGHAAHARHHLQDDHRRDDRGRDRGRLRGRLHRLKLYFMIGLPRETHAEVQGIVDLGIRAPRDRPRGARHERALHACTSAPPTSCPSRTRRSSGRACRRRDQLAAKQRLHAPGDADAARSGSRCTTCAPRCSRARSAAATRVTADVIERAWRAGARFDAWTELFQEQAWHDAFAAARHAPWMPRRPGVRRVGRAAPGTTSERACRRSSCSTSGGRARPSVATGDCRWDGCTDCGACFGPVRNRLVMIETPHRLRLNIELRFASRARPLPVAPRDR